MPSSNLDKNDGDYSGDTLIKVSNIDEKDDDDSEEPPMKVSRMDKLAVNAKASTAKAVQQIETKIFHIDNCFNILNYVTNGRQATKGNIL